MINCDTVRCNFAAADIDFCIAILSYAIFGNTITGNRIAITCCCDRATFHIQYSLHITVIAQTANINAVTIINGYICAIQCYFCTIQNTHAIFFCINCAIFQRYFYITNCSNTCTAFKCTVFYCYFYRNMCMFHDCQCCIVYFYRTACGSAFIFITRTFAASYICAIDRHFTCCDDDTAVFTFNGTTCNCCCSNTCLINAITIGYDRYIIQFDCIVTAIHIAIYIQTIRASAISNAFQCSIFHGNANIIIFIARNTIFTRLTYHDASPAFQCNITFNVNCTAAENSDRRQITFTIFNFCDRAGTCNGKFTTICHNKTFSAGKRNCFSVQIDIYFICDYNIFTDINCTANYNRFIIGNGIF